ncbi:hypothetical protein HU200_047221 [Digitaria exilis]|uniref:Uncharacterized protein n=1 Tax=Digitaria exilis TaxID=1010633 RepID=A0A835E8G0_9POAL|nr:hypothetical protein HU200_047221 [Digitaria exilis]
MDRPRGYDPTSTRPPEPRFGSSASLLLSLSPSCCSPASTDASPSWSRTLLAVIFPPASAPPPSLPRPLSLRCSPSVTSPPGEEWLLRPGPPTRSSSARRALRHASTTAAGSSAGPLRCPTRRSRATASGAEIRPYLNRGLCSLLVSDPGLLGRGVLPCFSFSGSRFHSQLGSKSLVLGSVGCELLQLGVALRATSLPSVFS